MKLSLKKCALALILANQVLARTATPWTKRLSVLD